MWSCTWVQPRQVCLRCVERLCAVSVTEKQTSIYDIAFLDTEELAHMSFLVALVDKRADPDGALMEYSFKIASTAKTAARRLLVDKRLLHDAEQPRQQHRGHLSAEELRARGERASPAPSEAPRARRTAREPPSPDPPHAPQSMRPYSPCV